MREISSKVFKKGEIRSYVAIYSFLILGMALSSWLILNIIHDSFHYEVLAGLILTWATFIVIVLDYKSKNIKIYKNKIVLPKTISEQKTLKYDEIKKIRFDVFKKTGNVGKLEIIDVNGKKHRISSFADKTKMLREIKKRMSKEHWKRKAVKEGYR